MRIAATLALGFSLGVILVAAGLIVGDLLAVRRMERWR